MGVFLMLLLLLVPPLSLSLPLYLPPHLPPWLLLHCSQPRQVPHQELVALHPCHQERGPLFEQVYLTATIVLLIARNVRVGSCLQYMSLPGMRTAWLTDATLAVAGDIPGQKQLFCLLQRTACTCMVPTTCFSPALLTCNSSLAILQPSLDK